ncbi:MAG: PilZ domain-containing protein [Candidatus Omnitrophica bacterium]|nr:PilZ domain-containing protein [Candidatus Omnitrophota bacterium]
MEERRQFVRLDTRLEVTFSVLPSGAPQQAMTRDISGGGICLFADRELAAGTRLQVTMKLPDREPPVHFTAEVVWSEAYETIGRAQRTRAIEVGVRFVEIAPQDQEAVMRHVILTMKPPSSR